jgi:hypothetical protein
MCPTNFLRHLRSRAAIGRTIRSLSLPKAYPEAYVTARLLYSEAIFDRDKRFFHH